jgi:hypothetical protein
MPEPIAPGERRELRALVRSVTAPQRLASTLVKVPAHDAKGNELDDEVRVCVWDVLAAIAYDSDRYGVLFVDDLADKDDEELGELGLRRLPVSPIEEHLDVVRRARPLRAAWP